MMEASEEKEYVTASASRNVDWVSGIHSALQTLFLGDKYSDLILVCAGERFRVHRAVVCPQSKLLDDKCQSVSLG
jgi:hypothetical protein